MRYVAPLEHRFVLFTDTKLTAECRRLSVLFLDGLGFNPRGACVAIRVKSQPPLVHQAFYQNRRFGN